MIKYICKCLKECEKRFNNIIYYGGAYCVECIKQNRVDKIRNTCKERYGVVNPSQLQDVKDKKNETYDKHFGCHPLQSKEIQDKRSALYMEKHGYKNPAQNPEVKEKIKETFIEKYGGHPMFDDTIKTKVKDTCFEKYGGYPGENELVKQKMVNTFNEKYGCDHPLQVPDILEKSFINAKKYKKYTLPSGKIINIQGYEHFALDIIFKTYTEEQILTQRKDIPRIQYIADNKTKYYFPDIFISSENRIIEVKSSWTYKKDLDKNKLKEKYTIDSGYKFEFWIFDRCGNRIYAKDDNTFTADIAKDSYI